MSGLTDSQQRYITAVFTEVGKHLGSIESLIEESRKHSADQLGGLSPQECTTLLQAVEKMRTRMKAAATGFALPHPATEIPVRWNVRTHLEFADVEFQELGASKLRGYGLLDTQAYTELEKIVNDLRRHLGDMLGVLA